MRILIMGLSGSGKTTLAKELCRHMDLNWLNADEIRTQYNDWDFSTQGRMRQAYRMRELADAGQKPALMDFIAPLKAQRVAVMPDFTIWLDTVDKSKFADTDAVFQQPESVDLVVTTKDCEFWARQLIPLLLTRAVESGKTLAVYPVRN